MSSPLPRFAPSAEAIPSYLFRRPPARVLLPEQRMQEVAFVQYARAGRLHAHKPIHRPGSMRAATSPGDTSGAKASRRTGSTRSLCSSRARFISDCTAALVRRRVSVGALSSRYAPQSISVRLYRPETASAQPEITRSAPSPCPSRTPHRTARTGGRRRMSSAHSMRPPSRGSAGSRLKHIRHRLPNVARQTVCPGSSPHQPSAALRQASTPLVSGPLAATRHITPGRMPQISSNRAAPPQGISSSSATGT